MKQLFIYLCLLLVSLQAAAKDKETLFSPKNLSMALSFPEAVLNRIKSIHDTLVNFEYYRSPLKTSEIFAPGGWKFRAAYLNNLVRTENSIQTNILLNQTQMIHEIDEFRVVRTSQVLKLVIEKVGVSFGHLELYSCSNPETYGAISFIRKMTSKQVDKFIPNPIVAIAKAASIGFSNISKDPFLHFDQLLKIFNPVEGVSTEPTDEERIGIEDYSQKYQIFHATFDQNIPYTNPCDQGNGTYTQIPLSEILLF